MKMKKVLGRIDKIDFLDFDLQDIPAKVDSGIYTSRIHCSHIQEHIGPVGSFITFRLLDFAYSDNGIPTHTSHSYKQCKVQNSIGEISTHYVIDTTAVLFGELHLIELALCERTGMRYPVLLGRKFFGENFLVDVSKVNLSHREKVNTMLKI